MKKCLLSILLATVLLCACAQQTDNTLQTPESSTLVELTVATEETAIETPAPLATESPAPAPTQTPEPTATPASTEIPIPAVSYTHLDVYKRQGRGSTLVWVRHQPGGVSAAAGRQPAQRRHDALRAAANCPCANADGTSAILHLSLIHI